MLNRWQIIGYVSKEPEVKTFDTGSLVTLTVKQSKKWRDTKGEQKEKTIFINLTAYAGVADNIIRYVTNGARIFCEGEIEPYSYEKEDGTKIFGHRFVIREFVVLQPAQNQTRTTEIDLDTF